jgi:hypothetical protein
MKQPAGFSILILARNLAGTDIAIPKQKGGEYGKRARIGGWLCGSDCR